MTCLVFSDIVPLNTAAFACAISRSASGVAGTIESRLTATPGSLPAASATAAFIRSSSAPLFADVAVAAFPGGHRIVHAAVGRVVVHESLAQPAAHVMHRRRIVGEQLEQAHSFVPAAAGGEHHAHHHLLAVVVCPVMEFKVPALLRSPHAPAREYPRDVDHVLLGVAAIHAQRVQLEQLAGVILVDAL